MALLRQRQGGASTPGNMGMKDVDGTASRCRRDKLVLNMNFFNPGDRRPTSNCCPVWASRFPSVVGEMTPRASIVRHVGQQTRRPDVAQKPAVAIVLGNNGFGSPLRELFLGWERHAVGRWGDSKGEGSTPAFGGLIADVNAFQRRPVERRFEQIGSMVKKWWKCFHWYGKPGPMIHHNLNNFTSFKTHRTSLPDLSVSCDPVGACRVSGL
ncbi:MAG: hypothetical protein CM15mP60_2860 [Alphaproteobacteria bacterium]|nr:MAG: hypothetical protein CM15mP60_2860 [Alphaproteobacteria bacterium]